MNTEIIIYIFQASLFIGCLLLIAGAGFLFFSSRKKRQDREEGHLEHPFKFKPGERVWFIGGKSRDINWINSGLITEQIRVRELGSDTPQVEKIIEYYVEGYEFIRENLLTNDREKALKRLMWESGYSMSDRKKADHEFKERGSLFRSSNLNLTKPFKVTFTDETIAELDKHLKAHSGKETATQSAEV